MAVYMTYFKGAVLRARSPFAQNLSHARDEKELAGDVVETARVTQAPQRPTGARQRNEQGLRIDRVMGSYCARTPQHSPPGTPKVSPTGTPAVSRRNSEVFAQDDVIVEEESNEKRG